MALTLVFGCYERSIFGYHLESNPDYEPRNNDNNENGENEIEEEEPLILNQIFAYASHLGSVRSVAAVGSTLATGSTDEVINIYDLKRQKEVGQLHNHAGSITVVAFAGVNNNNNNNNKKASHMISGSSDGTMCLWMVEGWKCMHSIKVHSGAVVSLALHPSNRLALSVGTDLQLKIWNLLSGKLSHSLPLEHSPAQVLFNPSGTCFILVFPDAKKIAVYNLDGSVSRTLEFPYKITTAVFLTDTMVAAGSEEGSVGVWDTTKGFSHAINLSNTTRIKSMSTLPSINHIVAKEFQNELPPVVLACSDGLVIVINLSTGVILATTNTQARLMCSSVTIVNKGEQAPAQPSSEVKEKKQKKRKDRVSFNEEIKEEVVEEEEEEVTEPATKKGKGSNGANVSNAAKASSATKAKVSKEIKGKGEKATEVAKRPKEAQEVKRKGSKQANKDVKGAKGHKEAPLAKEVKVKVAKGQPKEAPVAKEVKDANKQKDTKNLTKGTESNKFAQKRKITDRKAKQNKD